MKGFINFTLFLNWIEFFAKSVPDSVAYPLVLVYDGCCSHFNYDILKIAVELKVTLVILPYNDTHFIQPLDIAIFKPFKSVLKRCVSEFILENDIITITKKMKLLLGQNLGEKVFNIKIQILLLYLERQVCELFIFLSCRSTWNHVVRGE